MIVIKSKVFLLPHLLTVLCAAAIFSCQLAARAEDNFEFYNDGQSEWCRQALNIPFKNTPVSGQIAGNQFLAKKTSFHLWWKTPDGSYSRVGGPEYGKKYSSMTLIILGTKPISGFKVPNFEFSFSLSELPHRKTIPLPHRLKGDKLNSSNGGLCDVDANNEHYAGRIEIMPMDGQGRIPGYICLRTESSIGKGEINGYFYAEREH